MLPLQRQARAIEGVDVPEWDAEKYNEILEFEHASHYDGLLVEVCTYLKDNLEVVRNDPVRLQEVADALEIITDRMYTSEKAASLQTEPLLYDMIDIFVNLSGHDELALWLLIAHDLEDRGSKVALRSFTSEQRRIQYLEWLMRSLGGEWRQHMVMTFLRTYADHAGVQPGTALTTIPFLLFPQGYALPARAQLQQTMEILSTELRQDPHVVYLARAYRHTAALLALTPALPN